MVNSGQNGADFNTVHTVTKLKVITIHPHVLPQLKSPALWVCDQKARSRKSSRENLLLPTEHPLANRPTD